MSSKRKKNPVYCGKRPPRSLRIYDLRVFSWGLPLFLQAQCGQSVGHSVPLTSGNLTHMCIKYSLPTQSRVWCQEWKSTVVTLGGQRTSAWEGDLLLRAFLERLADSVSSQVLSPHPREVGQSSSRAVFQAGLWALHNMRKLTVLS